MPDNINFEKKWITGGADANMVKFADAVGLKIKDLSSSQIRNIYGEMKRIQVKGFDKATASFYLLKPKVAYAYGRSIKGKKASEEMETFKKVFDAAFDCVTDARTYENFCNFIEAILAYHKFHGGK